MFKVDNKYNYPLLIIILLWTIVACYVFIYTSIDRHYCATQIVKLALILVSAVMYPIGCLITIIINKICKIKYQTDLYKILILFIITIIAFIISISI